MNFFLHIGAFVARALRSRMGHLPRSCVAVSLAVLGTNTTAATQIAMANLRDDGCVGFWPLLLHPFLDLPKTPTGLPRWKRWARESFTLFDMFFEIFGRVAHQSGALGRGNPSMRCDWLGIKPTPNFYQKAFDRREFRLDP